MEINPEVISFGTRKYNKKHLYKNIYKLFIKYYMFLNIK